MEFLMTQVSHAYSLYGDILLDNMMIDLKAQN